MPGERSNEATSKDGVRLDGVTVAMLGGDRREWYLLRALLAAGATVHAVGYASGAPSLVDTDGHSPIRLDEGDKLIHFDQVAGALPGADAVVAPMTNTDETGVVTAKFDATAHIVLNDEAFSTMAAEGQTLFIGMAKPIIEQLAARHRVRVVQVADVDDVAILNAIPTAEGAIFRAMEALPVTLHGTPSAVVGFGRCGVTLARMLAGIGSRVVVVARDAGQLARAYEMGLATARWEELPSVAARVRVLFNTVPARVITRAVLERMPSEAVIIDVASSPGGTDFRAAESLGIAAWLELGIPGKVAPETAGAILARTVPRLIVTDIQQRRFPRTL